MTTFEKVFPPRVPIIFNNKVEADEAKNKAFRKIDMIDAPICTEFDVPTDSRDTVDTSNLNEDQIEALAKVSLPVWCVNTQPTVDGKPFSFNDRRYLLPLYSDDADEIAVKKASQMGASTYMFLKTVHALNRWPIKVGIYLPTGDLIGTMAKDRLDPILKENPQFIPSGSDVSKSVRLKHIGLGSLYLLYMGGRATKDSVPLDMIMFDEVRLMEMKDINQAMERISASKFQKVTWLSTPGYPDRDIDRLFQQSTQGHWHCKCRCSDGVCLPLVFPDCIMQYRNEVFYICPKCRTKINDPQNGFFVEYNPGNTRKGYHFSQMISRTMPPAKLWKVYNETENISEFYNAKLGLAYQDDDNISIKEKDLYECVNDDLRWDERFNEYFMGVDQMAGLISVEISAINKDNKKQVVHLELIDSKSRQYREYGREVTPFKRLYELMDIYNIKFCLIDYLPNTNEALEFARTYPGKVFLVMYTKNSKEMVQWADKEKIGQKRASDSTKYKYRCFLNRYMAIDHTLSEWRNKKRVIPNPRSLQQEIRNSKGEFEPEFMGELLFKHLQGVIRHKRIINRDTGDFVMEWLNKSFDPHFLHSDTYCCFAAERSMGHRALGVISRF